MTARPGSFLTRLSGSVVLLCGLMFQLNATEQEQAPSSKPAVTVVASEARPYRYRDPGDTAVKGEDVEFLKSFFKAADIPWRLNLVPWTRAMATARGRPNHLILPLSRTPEREDEFIWIMPMRKAWFAIYGKGPATLEELKTRLAEDNSKVYCEGATIQCTLLLNAGIAPDQIVSYPDANFDKLVMLASRQRIKYFVTEVGRIQSILELYELGSEDLPMIYQLPEPVTDYLALSKNSDPEIIETLKSAADRLRSGQPSSSLNPANEDRPSSR